MKAVLFDLDYTLYNTDNYYLDAFQDISKYLEEKYGLSATEVNKTLIEMSNQREDKYSHLFDDLLKHYNLNNEKIQNIVKVFNNHEINASSHLYPDAINILKTLREKNYKLAIITDGNLARQTRKIQTLELEKLVDNITYTENTKPKPSTLPFLAALDSIKVEPSDSIYIADNPFVDFKGPRTLGIKTVRILRGRFIHVAHDGDVDYTIKKLDEILDILASN